METSRRSQQQQKRKKLDNYYRSELAKLENEWVKNDNNDKDLICFEDAVKMEMKIYLKLLESNQ